MWAPRTPSPAADAIYRAAEADQAADPRPFRLEPDAIAARVLAKWPDRQDDETDWREGFERYVTSARDEGRLNALGQRQMAAGAAYKLGARFAIEATLRGAPEVSARKIDRPIFVIGGWRTGTTLLQRLLDSVPALRGARPSELTAPWRFHGLDAAAREALIDAGAAAHEMLHVLNPAMKAIHPSGARLAEECNLAMGTDFRNWSYAATLRCPSYIQWLTEQDMRSSYRRYADILRLLDDGRGRRWILKGPVHCAELPSLFAAFPDAKVIHLHRDVVQTVTSGSSLFAEFRSIYSDNVDAADVGRYQLKTTALWFGRALAARETLPDKDFVDISFAQLVADPLGAIRHICHVCDVPWTAEATESTGARLVELNKQHGAHRYTPEDFGLDRDEIQARLSAYTTRFGLHLS